MKDLNKNSKGYKFIPDRIPVDWNKTYLGKIGRFSKGNGITKAQLSETGSPCIRYGEIYTTHDFVIKKFHSFISDDTAKESKEIAFGDLLFAGSGETLEEIGKCVAYIGNDKAYAGGDIIIFSPTDEIDTAFLSFLLHTDYVCRQKRRIGQGHSVVHIYSSDIANIQVAIPTHLEQVKISKTFSIWDKAIEKTESLIVAKEQLKKGLMQQLLSGKKRLLGFKGELEFQKICEVAEEVASKNRDNKELTVLSCTKYDGLVPSLEYFGRKIYSDNLTTYKIVPKNHFAYATNHIEEGSIGFQENYEEALISPMYTVFKTDDSINDNFLFSLLKTYNYIHEYKKRMEGSIDRRGGLRWEEFSKIKIPLISFEEQSAISKILSTISSEIQLLESQLELYRQQKKGLMQVLLTGAVRVKL